jgi:hypothetical protein
MMVFSSGMPAYVNFKDTLFDSWQHSLGGWIEEPNKRRSGTCSVKHIINYLKDQEFLLLQTTGRTYSSVHASPFRATNQPA